MTTELYYEDLQGTIKYDVDKMIADSTNDELKQAVKDGERVQVGTFTLVDSATNFTIEK